MKEEVDLNNSDDTEDQSLSTKGVNLVPNDQVRLEYTEEYNTYLVPNDQEVEIGNQVLSTSSYIPVQTIERKEQ